MRQSGEYRLLESVPEIGRIPAPVILLEACTIGRFADVGHYASYAHCVQSRLACVMCSLHRTRGGASAPLRHPCHLGDGRLTAHRLIPTGAQDDSFPATIRRNGCGNTSCTGLKQKFWRLAPQG